jgi:hypothetical protein
VTDAVTILSRCSALLTCTYLPQSLAPVARNKEQSSRPSAVLQPWAIQSDSDYEKLMEDSKKYYREFMPPMAADPT